MRAVFVLGTFEPNAVKHGQPLTARTEALLQDLAGKYLDGVEVIFAVEDAIMAGKDRHKIGIKRIREERPRVLEEIQQYRPDLVVCFGPVAAASVFGRGNLSESSLIRRRHDLFSAGPPAYYTYSLENVRRAAGLAQWLYLDLDAFVNGFTETQWGNYTLMLPGSLRWQWGPMFGRPDAVALDLETYPGLEYYHPEARIRMAQVSDRAGRAWVIQATPDSRFPQWLVDLIEDDTVTKVGSNIKYDYKWLRRFGIEMQNFDDTSTREHIIDESNPKKDLKSLTLKYLPRLGDYAHPHLALVKERGGWEHVRDDEQYQYAGGDAEASIATYLGQASQLEGLERPHRLMQKLYKVLAEIEFTGICVDTQENRRLHGAYERRLRELQAEIEQTLGPVNLNSTTQLARALHAAVPNIDLNDWRAIVGPGEDPEISTCREILERESHKDPVIKLVLQHRRYRVRLSTFIDGVHDKYLVQHHGHHFLHPNYRTDLVETFRLSSQAPNMMNMPVRDQQDPELSIKRQFVSRWPGGKILERDMSQIELRFAAWASQDPAMIAAIESGEDIHTWMAATLLDKTPEDITEQERYECKTRTFLIMYGGGANKLVDQLLKSDIAPRRISKGEAIGMIDQYFAAFPGLKRFIDATRKHVRNSLEVETAFGFRRRFVQPDWWRSSDGFRVERQAFNTLIQSGAACMTYCAMLALQNDILSRNLQSRMIAQVHDSIVIDVHPNELEEMIALTKTGMETASVEIAKEYGVDFNLPLQTDAKIGDSWGALTEVTTSE